MSWNGKKGKQDTGLQEGRRWVPNHGRSLSNRECSLENYRDQLVTDLTNMNNPCCLVSTESFFPREKKYKKPTHKVLF